MQLKSCVLTLLCGSLPVLAAAAKTEIAPKPTRAVEAKKNPAPEVPTPLGAKVITYSDREVARINTKIRFSTLLVLPPSEKILDYVTGDKDYWVIEGSQNLAYIKPAKAGAQTNLNLVTASSNVYSFLLVEISDTGNAEPDLKVYVKTKDEAAVSGVGVAPRFVSVQELESVRQQLAAAKEETRQAQQACQSEISKRINLFISNVRFPYRFEAGRKPFHVRSIYNDDKFTYIQARPEETPTLYEIKDGKPNLVNFDYKDGVYVVDKILDRGYLVVGKQKLGFRREE
jgi:type IV secretion system protein VirB9